MTIWDRGPTSCTSGRSARSRSRSTASGCAAATGCSRSAATRRLEERLDDPPHGPARGSRPGADARAHRADDGARGDRCRRDERNWSFEVKWDGVRAIAYVQPGRLRLESRNLNEITDAYPEVRGLIERARNARGGAGRRDRRLRSTHGRPSFERLQHRMHVHLASRRAPAGREHPGRVRDLRPAVPRRPVAARAALRAAARATGGARARRPRLARAGRASGGRGRGCSRRPGSRGSRVSSRSGSTPATSPDGARAPG